VRLGKMMVGLGVEVECCWAPGQQRLGNVALLGPVHLDLRLVQLYLVLGQVHLGLWLV